MYFHSHAILLAFIVTILAGLSTGIGSLMAFFAKHTNTKFLAVSLGFSGGVMIYVSMIDIFPTAKDALVGSLGEVKGNWITVIAFFSGMILAALIDKLVPELENPHEARCIEEMSEDRDNVATIANTKALMKTGVFAAIAIAIHNFPEGIATFTATLKHPTLGIAIAVAIALHNIPEGIAVSVPIYFATGSKRKAFWLSFLSGMAEPLGALLAWLILMPYINDTLFGILFAGVAGIMVFVAVDELLPASRQYGESHLSLYGLLGGMATMAISLLLFM
ncbi:MAG: zinc transporter ZupT [Eubacteriales bacterium]